MLTLPQGLTRLTVILAMAVAFVPAAAFAQLNGPNIKGDAGLKAGSQAPPGAYVAVPLWFYTADAVKDREGAERLSGSLDAAVFGVALNFVTTRKIFRPPTAWPLFKRSAGAAFQRSVTQQHDVAAARHRRSVPLTGNFYCSTMDNFEWINGYGDRFGMVTSTTRPRSGRRS